MRFYADLHIHSRYSRATSRDCDLEHLAWWARRKGITVVGTGDFTHPAWFDELRRDLVPAEPGLFRLRDDLDRAVIETLPAACRTPVRFLLSVEISTIYKHADRTRKVHHLIYVPDLDAAERFNRRLASIGNIASDGRPILGLDSRDLLEITLESGPGSYLVPAHIWTPWFAVLGSKSGFDAVSDCYRDLAGHIFAVETGLSSDPPMNWRVSALDRYRLVSNSDAHSPPALGREASVFDTDADYFALRRALENGEGYAGTVEFFPEEGKYHLDGHRKCGVRLEPAQTRRHGDLCPACGKPLTIGVLHRVENLADRPDGARPPGADDFRSLVPLPEIVGEILRVGPKSKTVRREIDRLVAALGPELDILERVSLDDLRAAGPPLFAEAIARLRRGQVIREAGYDGEYGVVRLFADDELRGDALFRLAPAAHASKPAPAPVAAPAPARPAPVSDPPDPPPDDVPTALRDLDTDQRAAAAIADGPLLIVAGPGTGKTRTLTHRIAHLIADRGVAPERILALTFTRRASEELRQRLGDLVPGAEILVTTFHGLGLRIVREQHAALGLSYPRIADDGARLAIIRALVGSAERDVRRLAAEVSEHKRNAQPHPLRERYDRALRERDLVDLDDLLALPVALLTERPNLAASYRERYAWICVDEYQDVDPLQYRLIRLLAPPGGNLCVIGDPDQAIYGFRGADVGCFLRFRQDYPGARVVQLSRNYRSSPAIVGGALQAIAPASLVSGRELRTVAAASAPPHIVLHEAASEQSEAEFVTRTIDQLLGGSSFFALDSAWAEGDGEGSLGFDDIAVLYRTDAQSAPLVESLTRAGIPFQKRSHDRLRDRPGVATLAQRLDGHAGPVAARLARITQDGQSSELQLAADLLAPLAERCGDDLDRFLTELALGAEVDTWDPRADRVSLLTLHAAKGLEFRVVFLVGCEDGLLPLRWGDAPVDLAEERRLFFVGMTRARSHLYLCHARRRLRHGSVQEPKPSPFLRAIDAALLDRQRMDPEPRRPSQPAAHQLQLL